MLWSLLMTICFLLFCTASARYYVRDQLSLDAKHFVALRQNLALTFQNYYVMGTRITSPTMRMVMCVTKSLLPFSWINNQWAVVLCLILKCYLRLLLNFLLFTLFSCFCFCSFTLTWIIFVSFWYLFGP